MTGLIDQRLEPSPLSHKPTKRYFQTAPCRVYSAREVYGLFKVSRRTFFVWKKDGRLPLVEVRVGRTIRYQAGPIDRYLAGQR